MSNETTHLIAAKTGARQAYEEYDVTASRYVRVCFQSLNRNEYHYP